MDDFHLECLPENDVWRTKRKGEGQLVNRSATKSQGYVKIVSVLRNSNTVETHNTFFSKKAPRPENHTIIEPFSKKAWSSVYGILELTSRYVQTLFCFSFMELAFVLLCSTLFGSETRSPQSLDNLQQLKQIVRRASARVAKHSKTD